MEEGGGRLLAYQPTRAVGEGPTSGFNEVAQLLAASQTTRKAVLFARLPVYPGLDKEVP